MEFSRIFDLTLPSTLQSRQIIKASDQECAAIAKRFDIPAVKAVEADFTITKDDNTRFIISGFLHAELMQTCVVTLMPVGEVVDEAMNIRVRLDEPTQDEEIISADLDDLEDIEYVPSAKVDVGELVVQYLSLAMNQYPRQEGVVALSGDDVSLDKKPFAKLSELKKK